MLAEHTLQVSSSSNFAVDGMTCGNCARHVTEAIQSVPQVSGASVNLGAGTAEVHWKDSPNVPAIVDAVKKAGYEARPLDADGAKATKDWSPLAGWKFNVVVGLACTIPLIVGEWVFGLGMTRWFQWVSFLIALPVQIFCGARFYAGAWRQLKRGSSNMDTLVALGSTTAFGYSLWALFAGHHTHLYFMESAAIITLISLGHWFEARTSARAEGSLRALFELAPQMARKRNPDNSESQVPVASLKADDILILKPGDSVPTDGEVAYGESSLDESMLTGESIPVDKTPGSKIFAGTINLNGQLFVRVTAVGSETALAHIIAAVQRAQNSRANIQRLGDRVSSVFVPIVVLIAIATGIFWGFFPEQARNATAWLEPYLWTVHLPANPIAAAFIHAAGVLIIACPCAMGLATPIAIMAGANAAARKGILIRDGIALEQAGTITALLFDKTGTLTQGKPTVVNQQTYVSGGKRPVVHEMKLAAALARRSNHPLSQAVAKLFPDEFPITDWEEIRGSGVQGKYSIPTYSGTPATIRMGSLHWLRESGVDLERGKEFAEEWSAQGGTILGIAADQWLLGMLAVEDTLKPGAKDVVQQLKKSGLKVYMITGDNPLTAAAIAKEAGIDRKNVFSEIKPEEKARIIQRLQEQGEKVAFVGDGINDAPALEAADLGIAVSRASDVAREASDIILLNSEIEAVPESIGLARATLRTIKQNLFWAFFYNAVGIPLAALGFLNPILCALAMGLSDIVVIGNALRLMRWNVFSLKKMGRKIARDLDLPDFLERS